MGGRGIFMKLSIAPEHADQVLFQSHHERVHPGVEHHVGTFKTHLRRITRRKVLYVHGCGNHGARYAQAFGNVALHLGTQYQLGLQFSHLGFNFQVVVGDQRLNAIQLGGVADADRESDVGGFLVERDRAQRRRGRRAHARGCKCPSRQP